MKILELLPIKEWEEKENDKPTGDIRLYIGSIHVGTMCRKNKNEELYSFHSLYYPITRAMDTSTYRGIEEIKMDVELYWKEHAVKFVKSLRTLVKNTSK